MAKSDRRRPGIRIRHLPSLRREEVTRFEGVPITTPARTLLDLAKSIAHRALERAVAEALARRQTTARELRRILGHHDHRPEARQLSALLGSDGPARTRSEAEEKLLVLIRKAKLPEPAVNVDVEGFQVDFHWPTAGLVVEVDGVAFHLAPAAFERDRLRDATLVAAGQRVFRVTWRQIQDEPEALLARLAQALVR
jgi:very-short-patch-repair endonuclease